MAYKRILTIQDISCVGQCSMAVAMPILSACGHETCILPTALLSTHTGGFSKPAVTHLDDALKPIWRHWQANGITFDAILVGYLGSISAIQTAVHIIDSLLAPQGVAIVDPVMGDHGRLYSGFDENYVKTMKELCRKADMILPNLTEVCLLTGEDYQDCTDKCYVNQLLATLNHPSVILTGAAFEPEKTGALLWEGEQQYHYTLDRVGSNFHGTGDMFAAAFTGALMQGKTKAESMKIAADFTKLAIEATVKAPAHWYGVKFEEALPALMKMVQP